MIKMIAAPLYDGPNARSRELFGTVYLVGHAGSEEFPLQITHDLRRGTICDLRDVATKRPVVHGEPLYSLACKALTLLLEKEIIHSIAGFDVTTPNFMRLPNGEFEFYTGSPAKQILGGYLAVTDKTPLEELKKLFQLERMTVDITGLSDLTHLPPRIEANLFSAADELHFPQHVRSLAHLDVPRAHHINLGGVRGSGNIHAPKVKYAEGHLVRAGDVYMPEFQYGNLLNSLQSVADLSLNHWRLPCLSMLESALMIDLESAEGSRYIDSKGNIHNYPEGIVLLPAIHSLSEICAPSALKISLPKVNSDVIIHHSRHVKEICINGVTKRTERPVARIKKSNAGPNQ